SLAPRPAARGPGRAGGVPGLGRPHAARRVNRTGPALGYALVWLFLIVFLVYPLGRIFYDAFTDESGRFTAGHFVAFAQDGFYLRSLWNSLLLGLGTVAGASVLGF